MTRTDTFLESFRIEGHLYILNDTEDQGDAQGTQDMNCCKVVYVDEFSTRSYCGQRAKLFYMAKHDDGYHSRIRATCNIHALEEHLFERISRAEYEVFKVMDT